MTAHSVLMGSTAHVLKKLALFIGADVPSVKPAIAAAILDRMGHLESLPKNKPRILSVDVGIKNFSFCDVSYQNPNKPEILRWAHVDLHQSFAGHLPPHSNLSRLNLAKVALKTVDLLLSTKENPSIFLIEDQRTRSNGRLATLPNVLRNYALQQMLTALLHEKCNQAVLEFPFSRSMLYFWLYSHMGNPKATTPVKSKNLRSLLVLGWLADPLCAPFDLSAISSHLPANFPSMSLSARTSALLSSFPFPTPPTKIDDVIDSLLYNLQMFQQIKHSSELRDCLLRSDVSGLVEKWDEEHLAYLKPLEKLKPLKPLKQKSATLQSKI